MTSVALTNAGKGVCVREKKFEIDICTIWWCVAHSNIKLTGMLKYLNISMRQGKYEYVNK